MINVDTKIGSKALCKRLEKVLPDIIHHNQNAFVQGRSIFDAIRTIDDIMEYTRIMKLSGFLITIDFEKAFDSVNHSFLTKTLEAFNFGPSFIRWASSFNCNLMSCIMNNGFSTEYFPISRGVRQGDPLSPYLFLMVLEIFVIHVRENNCIKGIVVENEEIKLCAFADDLTTFLRDVSSYKHLVESLNRFEQCSGLKVNSDKTEALSLGVQDPKNSIVELRISKIEIPIKILGIHWTYNQQQRDKLNFYNLLESIKKQLTFWKWRHLTIIGKIQILKTFIIPKLTYRASIIHYSKDTLKQCNKILYDFVWNGRDKVKRMAIINEIENGGLKMPHLESIFITQRISCLKRLSEEYHSSWKYILKFFLKKVGGVFVLCCNFDPKLLGIKSFPPFYNKCLLDFASVQTFSPCTIEEVLLQPIWNNAYILKNGKSIFDQKLYNLGLVRLVDIISEEGRLLTYDNMKETLSNLSGTDYFQLISIFYSLPSEWKRMIANTTNALNISVRKKRLVFEHFDKLISLNSKAIYQLIKERVTLSPSAQSKWNQIFPDRILIWKDLYIIPYQCTLDTKLREFQFKILHRILTTNYSLYKMSLAPSPVCSFCDHNDESLRHLFVHCSFVSTFWDQILNWNPICRNNFDNLDDIAILFGIPSTGQTESNYLILNTIILVGKQTIYQCRKKLIKPSFALFLAKTDHLKSLEYQIAKKEEN